MSMLKKYFFFFLVTALTLFALGASAQGRPADGPGVRNTPRPHATSSKTASTTRAKVAAALSELQKERVRSHARQMVAILRATAERIESIGNKLETRIRKLETGSGITLTVAKGHLAESRIKLAEARVLITAVPSEVEEALKGPDPKAAWKTVREKIEQARNAVRLAHEHLIKSTAAVRFGLNKNRDSQATTTASSTRSN